MTRRGFNTILIISLAVALIALSGCTLSKSQGPTAIPTAGPKAVGTATTPAQTTIPPQVLTQVASSPTPQPPAQPTQPAPTPTPKPPLPTPTAAAPVPPSGPTTYVVKQGDWLWKIAREKGVSPQAIAAANPGIDINLLKPGQPLIIPGPEGPQPTPAPGTGQTIHVVQKGDTLFSIARKYDRTVQAIAAANGITNVHLIYPGQKLVIP